jgi:hypothetical protein
VYTLCEAWSPFLEVQEILLRSVMVVEVDNNLKYYFLQILDSVIVCF